MDQRTKSAWIFGAICPARGVGAALVLPRCNTQAMQWHLDEIATQVSPGRRVGITGPGRLIDRLQAHQTHQASNPMTADAIALASQLMRHLAGAVKWIFEKQLIDAPHQPQVRRVLPLQCVME